MVELLTTADFEKKTKKGAVVVDFFAEWCGPCKMLAPVFENVKKDFEDVKFFKVNVESEEKLASELNVMSIPTIIFYRDGQEIHRNIGLLSQDNLKKQIKELFS